MKDIVIGLQSYGSKNAARL